MFRVRSGETAHASLPLPDRPSLVVLPFQNMSGDPEQEYFADGMVEEITTALSRVRSLFVIARNSAFIYKGRAVDVRQVGRDLGVRYVLEGSVRKAGSRVRITGQLIEAESGSPLVSHSGLLKLRGLKSPTSRTDFSAPVAMYRNTAASRSTMGKPPWAFCQVR